MVANAILDSIYVIYYSTKILLPFLFLCYMACNSAISFYHVPRLGHLILANEMLADALYRVMKNTCAVKLALYLCHFHEKERGRETRNQIFLAKPRLDHSVLF